MGIRPHLIRPYIDADGQLGFTVLRLPDTCPVGSIVSGFVVVEEWAVGIGGMPTIRQGLAVAPAQPDFTPAHTLFTDQRTNTYRENGRWRKHSTPIWERLVHPADGTALDRSTANQHLLTLVGAHPRTPTTKETTT